jgi:hypothetical protein
MWFANQRLAWLIWLAERWEARIKAIRARIARRELGERRP